MRESRDSPWLARERLIRRVYHHGVDPVTAFVLAGGKSSRMGRTRTRPFCNWEKNPIGARLDLQRHRGKQPETSGLSEVAEKFAGFGPVVEDIYPGTRTTGRDSRRTVRVSHRSEPDHGRGYALSSAGFSELPDRTGARQQRRGRGAKGGGGLQPLCRRVPARVRRSCGTITASREEQD